MASKVLSAAAPKSNHALALTNWLHDPFFRSGFGPMSLFRDNWPNMPASLADFAKFPLAMDLEETNNEIIAKVDIPSGVKFEDLKLTINDDGALVLSGGML
jgi:HSP20 family molecular chaperone IbpA